MTRFRTQDTRASTARKLNAVFAGNAVAANFFAFRETPQTYDQWDLQLEGLRKALAAALYDVAAVDQFRTQDTRQLRCYKLNRLAEVVAQEVAPTNLNLPTISGDPVVGQTLTVSAGGWSGNPVPTLAYQWKRDDAAISGATTNEYTLVEADEGAVITVTVTATNTEGTASATSAGAGPVEAAPTEG